MFKGPELVEQLPYLRRMAHALTKNRADADDLAQGCLERAIVYQHQFTPGTNLRGWLLAIMHNLFIDNVRRAKRQRENSESAQAFLGGLHTPGNQDHSLQLGELQTAMAQLPIEQYSTLILVVLENMSYEEAAYVTKVPVGTIRSRLSRARASIARYLEGDCPADAINRPKLRRRRHHRQLPGPPPSTGVDIGK